MFCQNCGKALETGAVFCPHCGTKVQAAQGTSAPGSVENGAHTAPVAQSKAQVNVQPAVSPATQSAQPSAPMPQQQFVPAYPVPPAPVKKKSKAGAVVGIIAGVIAVIAVIAVVFIVLSGNKEQKKFVGEWNATTDFTEIITKSMGGSKQYLEKDFSVAFDMHFSFRKDGTYEVTVDDATLKKAQQDLKAGMEKMLINSIRAGGGKTLDVYTDEQLKVLYEKSTGQSFDSTVDSVVKNFDIEEIKESGHLVGNFKVDEAHFYLSDGTDKQVDESVYAVYKIKDDTHIEVTDYIINGESSTAVFPTPFVMEKEQ